MYRKNSRVFGYAVQRSRERGLKRARIGKDFKRRGYSEFYDNVREYGHNNSETYGSGLRRYHG